MRLLYDREQVTARIVVRSPEDLETPLVSRCARLCFLPPRTERDVVGAVCLAEHDTLLSPRDEPDSSQV